MVNNEIVPVIPPADCQPAHNPDDDFFERSKLVFFNNNFVDKKLKKKCFDVINSTLIRYNENFK